MDLREAWCSQQIDVVSGSLAVCHYIPCAVAFGPSSYKSNSKKLYISFLIVRDRDFDEKKNLQQFL